MNTPDPISTSAASDASAAAVTLAPSTIDAAKLAPTTLIMGCGFLGRPLAKQLVALGKTVHGSTRSTDHAIDLAAMGVHPALLSVTQKLTFAALTPLLDGRPLDVIYLIPPGKPDQHTSPHDIVIGGITNTLASLRRANVRRAILVSSTAVYGSPQTDTESNAQPQTPATRITVTPQTPATPDNPRARLLLQGEDLWRQAGGQYHILRLCGLYGPRRIVGLSAIQQGAPIAGNPDALLNLIHVDDAVSLLLHILAADTLAPIELGSDTTPIPRQTYYNHLASLLQLPPPAVMNSSDAAVILGQRQGSRLDRTVNKACDPTDTCNRTGWQPRHTDFRLGLHDALARTTRKR